MTEEYKNQEAQLVSKGYNILYQVLEGAKLTHSEVVDTAKDIIPVSLHIPKGSALFETILEKIVAKYEGNVGIRTYNPDVIAADPNGDFWLYNKKKDEKQKHSYFHRYRQFLIKEKFDPKVIDNIESSCEKALSFCADPTNLAALFKKKRGLVVGDVQSGKTANYLGLINMACDYGYKIIILLAGLTDSLRQQTQDRIDEGFIGAWSNTIGGQIEYCGVGLKNREHYAIPMTNWDSDFAKFIQTHSNYAATDLNKPVVLVVKKNARILESVREWLKPGQNNISGNNILIIDDEADNASVNTNKPEKDPTKINARIREIYNNFAIASYVGFTATPFANIFINPYDEDSSNQDLFPADFIVQLKAPDNYFGGEKVFPENGETPLPRHLREIFSSEENFLPVIHKKDDDYFALQDSLTEAILSFLINNVVRTLRGDKTKHRSMMINITKYNDLQDTVRDLVHGYVANLKNVIEQDGCKPTEKFIKNREIERLYKLFTEDDFYEPIRNGSEKYPPVSWEEIKNGLYDEIVLFEDTVVNYRYRGELRYSYKAHKEKGARVIVVGGFVLSRGLTLEGLCVSYYSRSATAYDTLLQMCRWFGYRPGYEDLCRIYMTQASIDSFVAVLDAVHNMKEQFSQMALQHKKPKDFGLMIKESPETLETTLLVTSRNKMRHTDVFERYLNYGGVYADTSKLFKDAAKNVKNRQAVYKLIEKTGKQFDKYGSRYMIRQVDKLLISEFISQLSIPFENRKFDTENLASYISSSEIYPVWDIVIATGESCRKITGLGEEISAPTRSFHLGEPTENFIRIGGTNNRILDPGIFDSGENFSTERKKEILDKKNAAATDGKHYDELTALDYLKNRETPLLVLYPLDLLTDENDQSDIEKTKRFIKVGYGGDFLWGFAVGFPLKDKKERMKYRLNKVKMDERTQNDDSDEDEEEMTDD